MFQKVNPTAYLCKSCGPSPRMSKTNTQRKAPFILYKNLCNIIIAKRLPFSPIVKEFSLAVLEIPEMKLVRQLLEPFQCS